MNGARSSLWRAVEQDDNVLAILGPRRRTKQAAKQLCKKLCKGVRSVPQGLITDTLQSDAGTTREGLPGGEPRQSRALNNRCESSPRPTRARERRMPRAKSPGHAQRFLSAYGPIVQRLTVR